MIVRAEETTIPSTDDRSRCVLCICLNTSALLRLQHEPLCCKTLGTRKRPEDLLMLQVSHHHVMKANLSSLIPVTYNRADVKTRMADLLFPLLFLSITERYSWQCNSCAKPAFLFVRFMQTSVGTKVQSVKQSFWYESFSAVRAGPVQRSNMVSIRTCVVNMQKVLIDSQKLPGSLSINTAIFKSAETHTIDIKSAKQGTKNSPLFTFIVYQLVLFFVYVLIQLPPPCLSMTVTDNTSLYKVGSSLHTSSSLTKDGFHIATHYLQNISDFKPPIPSLPCRYRFRDDIETSALLADYILVGWPVRAYRRRYGMLYNISLYVSRVLKRAPESMFPVREQHLVHVGEFSNYPDFGRCWVDVAMNKMYVFFISRPDWAGFCRVTQLPVEYSVEAESRVRTTLLLGAYPLQMRPLYHADQLEVEEGNQIILTCQVRGRPTPLISWRHNQTSIDNPWRPGMRNGIIQTSRYLSKLQISKLAVADSGNYTCLAENLNGHIRKSVQIFVRPSTTTTLMPPMTSTRNPASIVHPCHDYCHRGRCYVIDGKPFCRCDHNYFGEHCQLYFPFSWGALQHLRPIKPRTNRRQKFRWRFDRPVRMSQRLQP